MLLTREGAGERGHGQPCGGRVGLRMIGVFDADHVSGVLDDDMLKATAHANGCAGVVLRPTALPQNPMRHIYAAVRAGAENSSLLPPVLNMLRETARLREDESRTAV